MTQNELEELKELVMAVELAAIDVRVKQIDLGIARLEAENAALADEQPVDVELLRVARYRLVKLSRQRAAGEIDQRQLGAALESVELYLWGERFGGAGQ